VKELDESFDVLDAQARVTHQMIRSLSESLTPPVAAPPLTPTPTPSLVPLDAAIALITAAGKLVNPPPDPQRTPPDLTDPYADDDADEDWAEPDDWSDIPGDTAIVMVSPDQQVLFPDPNLAGPDDAVFDDDDD